MCPEELLPRNVPEGRGKEIRSFPPQFLLSPLSQAHPGWQRSPMISSYSLCKAPGHALMNAELHMHINIYNFNTLINLCVAWLLFIMPFLVHRTGNCTESWKTPGYGHSDVSARLVSELKLCCWNNAGIWFFREKNIYHFKSFPALGHCSKIRVTYSTGLAQKW